MPAAGAVQFLRTPHEMASVAGPHRLRILAALREPGSATSVAKQVGLPRQKVNYHLRELESAGLVKLVEERRKRNCTERIVQATATSYLVDPAAMGALAADPDAIPDRFSHAYLVALLARSIGELAELRARADDAGKQLATLSLHADVRFATAEKLSAFSEELSNELARLIAKYHDDHARDGRTYRFVLGAHSALDRKADDKRKSDQ